MVAESTTKQQFWMRLDNAAKIYPAVQSKELTSVFRLSCVLKDRLKMQPLLEAVNKIEDRFPYYKVKLEKGFFWYYLEYHDEVIPLRPDVAMPCRAFRKNDLIFRVLVKENQLSVEFSHILTDGGGGFEFLKTLLYTYFDRCCISLKESTLYLRPDEAPESEEFEDAFSKYFQEKIPVPRKKPSSFHLPFQLNNPPRFKVLIVKAPLADISHLSRSNKVSITEYLVSIYLHSLQEVYNRMSPFQKRRQRKIFRVQVPVNLRKLYPSKTMRNFSLFVTPEIDLSLGQYSFEEILKIVHHFMQLETDKKLMNKIIARNVGAERNILLKNTPLFIKSLILYFTYRIAGTSRYSGVITNLGKVTFGEADKLIDHFIFIPPPPNKTLKVNCGVLGFNNSLVMSFGNITKSRELEREFLTFLVRQGVAVKIIKC
ncbi:MAG TPA: hypothetical protein VFU05_01755 [Cyclobacteriaceae bacterium]|nr:hypothetical protein [Cyclobacteriaceae bacterium]